MVRAASDTAIRPLTFSRAERSMGSAAWSALERVVAPWTVATMGPSKTQQAISDRLGAAGSCTCRTSKLPSLSHRRTLLADSGPKDSLATEPL